MSNYVFYDNYDLDDMFEETKKELLDSETYTEDELTDYVVWNCVYDIDAENFNNIFQEIENWADNNQVLFIGSVARWNGTFAGGEIGDFSTLFTEAIEDCDFYKIWEEDNILNLKCSHHDGTNYFEIRILTNEGLNLYEDWLYDDDDTLSDLSEREIHQKLLSDPKYILDKSFSKYYMGYC